MLQSLLRKVLLRGPPEISRAEAMRLAHDACRRRGWPWQQDHARVREGLRCYHISTHAGGAHGSVTVRVDMTTGQVEHVGFTEMA